MKPSVHGHPVGSAVQLACMSILSFKRPVRYGRGKLISFAAKENDRSLMSSGAT